MVADGLPLSVGELKPLEQRKPFRSLSASGFTSISARRGKDALYV